jgi:hypothetical protein
MADSIRQQIMDKLDAQLKTITVRNLYEHDLGDNVFAWRDTENNPLQTSELPGLVYKDVTEERESHSFAADLHTLTVEMGVYFSGDDGPETMRSLQADLVKAISAKSTWDGLAMDSLLQNNNIEIEQKENKVMAMSIPLTIIFRTASDDDYTSP